MHMVSFRCPMQGCPRSSKMCWRDSRRTRVSPSVHRILSVDIQLRFTADQSLYSMQITVACQFAQQFLIGSLRIHRRNENDLCPSRDTSRYYTPIGRRHRPIGTRLAKRESIVSTFLERKKYYKSIQNSRVISQMRVECVCRIEMSRRPNADRFE